MGGKKPKGAPPLDEWDRRTRGLRFADNEGMLVELARRYLEARKDQALGLAPVRLLPPRKAHAWILFWTAARRVDDFVEEGKRTVDEWRTSLDKGQAVTLAEQCMEAFLRRPEGAGTRAQLLSLLHQGLDGLDREPYFDQPRSLNDYLNLIHDKSATAMIILDRLLFPGESEGTLMHHAEAFAATTQIGDDCRDVRRDLAAGRCFVTREELGGQSSLAAYVKSSRFAQLRTAMCRHLLDKANAAAARFKIESHKTLAGRLSDFWLHAIESDQIRPTTKTLQLPLTPPGRTKTAAAPPRKILAVLEDRF